MPVNDIMTRKLITVSPKLTVGEALPMFKQFNIHHLLVVIDGKLVGIISDRDVLKNISPFAMTAAADKKDSFTLTRHVEKIMTTNLVTVSPQAGITEACTVLLDHGVSLLPVLEKGNLVGVISWKDILRYFVD